MIQSSHRLIGYGHTLCGDDWGMTDEYANFNRLYYVLGGTCRYTAQNESLILQKGRVYLLPKYVPYSLQQDPSDHLFVLWQHVRLEQEAKRTLIECAVAPDSALFLLLHCVQRLTQNQLVEVLGEDRSDLVNQLEGLSYVLLLLLDEQAKLYDPSDERLRAALYLLHSHPQSPVSVAQLAAQAGMERSYFTRLFKERFSISPQQFILRSKMDLAARLLLEGKSVATVAVCVGYGDTKSFSRAFSNQKRVSPSAYAHSHRLQP